MATQVITEPVLTDSTGQDIVEGLAGIANAVQPINIYLDVPITIPVSGWSATVPHQYTWMNARITTECGIEVAFTDGAENVDMKYLEYDKILGGIQFEIDQIPDRDIPLIVRIINASTTAVIDPVDASLVETNAVPGASNVQQALENHESRISTNEDAISDLEDDVDTINSDLNTRLKSVNGIAGDENGNVEVNETEFAHQIVTDDAQQSTGEFTFRTTGGDASLSDGSAVLVSLNGRSVHTGEVADSLNMVVNAVQRTATPNITAELDSETFIAYVETEGVYTILYTNEWSTDPELYGITITNEPEYGDRVTVEWDGVTEPNMTVFSNHVVPEAITATIDKDVFEAYVSQSGTYTLSYTSSWSENPALYGVTVVNDPVNGDEIVITYVKSDRGTITISTPTSFASTGWNLYDNSTGKKYARVKKYSSQYGFLVGGSHATLEFSQTLNGSRTTITPASGYFAIPADGYVFVTGGDDTTYIMMTWSDWTEGYEGEFQTYTETTVDLTSIMVNFPYGLCQVGAITDEINFSMNRAISRIDRMAYSAENLAYAKSTGRAYDADTNYIYIEKETEDVYTFSVSGMYTAYDHGCEYITGSDIPVYVETLYGQNLVDKLRTDVVTISQQSLTSSQQAQVRTNIGVATTDFGNNIPSLATLESYLKTLADSMSDNQVKFISFATPSGGYGILKQARYIGELKRMQSDCYVLEVQAFGSSGAVYTACYRNSVWTWDCIDRRLDGIEIPANTDLDTLTDPGNYYSANSSRTATLTNVPDTGAGFSLVVQSKGGNLEQQVYMVGYFYTRAKTSSGFSEWKSYAYTHVDQVTEVTNLSSIDYNTHGRIVLSNSIKPEWSGTSTFNYICLGNSAYRTLQISDVTLNRSWIATKNGSSASWTNWDVVNLGFCADCTAGDTTFNIPANARLMLAIEDSSVNRCGLYFVVSTSASAVSYRAIAEAQDLTLTPSTGKITITVPSGGRAVMFTSTSGSPRVSIQS